MKNDNNDDSNDKDKKNDMNIEAIVAEVSNTPWNEMYCYVLHPDSKDMTIVQDGRARRHRAQETYLSMSTIMSESTGPADKILNDAKGVCVGSDSEKKFWKSMNYIFSKNFHVSPFMEMDYTYDWTFWDITYERIMVSATMIKKPRNMNNTEETKPEESSTSSTSGVKCFNAFFDISRTPFTPFQLCYQLVRFPIYCMIIQIWIHIEAAKLFYKGVTFIPHPEGSETAASAAIGHAMAPFFAFKSWMAEKRSKSKDGSEAKSKSD